MIFISEGPNLKMPPSEFLISKIDKNVGKLTISYKNPKKKEIHVFNIYQKTTSIGKYLYNDFNFPEDLQLPGEFIKFEFSGNNFYASSIIKSKILKIRLSPEHFESEPYKLIIDDIFLIGKTEFQVVDITQSHSNSSNNLIKNSKVFDLSKSISEGNFCMDCNTLNKTYQYSCNHNYFCKFCIGNHPICETCQISKII